MKLLFVSAVSATFELDNDSIYYSNKTFNVYLNGQIILTDVNTNVFSIYYLSPFTEYEISVDNCDEKLVFSTDRVSEIISTEGICCDGTKDVTKDLQNLIDQASRNSLIIINDGKYLFTSLKLKPNITLFLSKNALLSASVVEGDYEEIPSEITLEDGSIKQIGSWEGSPSVMKLSLINAFDCENIKIVGEGTIDANAQLSTWWNDFRNKPYARPHILYYVHSSNIVTQGISLKNSPQWTVHPYFSKDISFYNLSIENPKISPNTDGINPECSERVNIIGVHFSVGDDCIALKSGKMYIGKKYKIASKDIVIRNCLMQYGHGAVVLGSEMSGGIKDIVVEKCVFDHTDRGLRIKTRRGRGNTAVIDGVTFSNILMKNVLTPLVINMFYFCDPDGKTEYVYSKEKLPVDDNTPYLGKFTFEKIKAIDVEYAAGYFYGLPEMPIGEINIKDCSFDFKYSAEKGTPAMMSFAEECCKRGFVFNNVKRINIQDFNMCGQEGDEITTDHREEVLYVK